MLSLWIDVFGEPVGRQLAAEAARTGIAVDERPERRELIAQPDKVEESGDLPGRAAARDVPEHEVMEARQSVLADGRAHRAAHAVRALGLDPAADGIDHGG